MKLSFAYVELVLLRRCERSAPGGGGPAAEPGTNRPGAPSDVGGQLGFPAQVLRRHPAVAGGVGSRV
eukprot:3763582-Lingulodinium_polyedra.AAC.1